MQHALVASFRPALALPRAWGLDIEELAGELLSMVDAMADVLDLDQQALEDALTVMEGSETWGLAATVDALQAWFAVHANSVLFIDQGDEDIS